MRGLTGERGPVSPAAAATATAAQRWVSAPAPTDWLFHRMDVAGPPAALAAFQAAAAGAGTLPWFLDYDRLQEDLYHRLVTPAHRTLSIEGARILAGQLRDAVERRHALAVTRVGRSTACPFDLHSLVPVPAEILRLGPDHPEALAWLWAHWGTTELLRHVVAAAAGPGAPPGTGQTLGLGRRPRDRASDPLSDPGGDTALWRLSFWSADWTPWQVLARIRQDWSSLSFDMRPVYDGP